MSHVSHVSSASSHPASSYPAARASSGSPQYVSQGGGSPSYQASGSPQSDYRQASTSGGSILREERQNEESKQSLSLDEHRNRVRQETEQFIDHVSPQRLRELSGSPGRY